MSAEDWIDFGTIDEEEQGYLESRAGESMRDREQEAEFVVISDVKFLRRTDKALLVKFPGGGQRWIPIGQTPDGFDPEVPGDGDLEITQWLADKLEDEEAEEPEEDVEVPDCVVLRETEKAVQVRGPSFPATWIPRGQLREGNECENDGDRGKLVISAWIAQQKDIGGVPRKTAEVNVGQRVQQQGRSQRRQTWGEGEGSRGREDPRQTRLDDLPPPDDDIPF